MYLRNNSRISILTILCALVLLLPGNARASTISLSMIQSASLRDGQCVVTVRGTNHGDEDAHAVWISAAMGSQRGRSRIVENLRPGESASFQAVLGEAPHPPGVHTIVVTGHYSDANGYPFSAVKTLPLTTAAPDDPGTPPTASVDPFRYSKQGRTHIRISNPGKQALDVTLSVAIPDELRVDAYPRFITVPAGGTVAEELVVNNVSALPGSTYAICALADWTSPDGLHGATVAENTLTIPRMAASGLPSKHWVLAAVLPLLAAFGLLQFGSVRRRLSWIERMPAVPQWTLPLIVLAAILVFTVLHLAPRELVRDTLTVGGDTPAHSYLVSHLKDQLFHHGRVVSWGGGWWCGFPMFQFYFSLPYLTAAILSALVPLNIAFKLISILGICILPVCAYAFGRMLRLPRPGPLVLAIAMVPFLFDRSHTMWGVNIYSTLAGMISNSLSFAIMLLFIGHAFRDSDDGRVRLRTLLLLIALIASHFFTTIMAGLTMLIVPLLRPRKKMLRAVALLGIEACMGFLLMAWWWVPLIAKRAYTAPFGTNWDVDILAVLPSAAVVLACWSVAGLGMAIPRRSRFVAVVLWMLAVATFLFTFGGNLSGVFVNVRLWPFMSFAFFALAAAGIGLALYRARASGLAVLALLAIALVYGPDHPREVRHWAEWNYSGLQGKPRSKAFVSLVEPLRGTPGRLANDLHPDNKSFGSTRIFECVPHLIEKPILEGGLVNSAAGSIFSYYIQSETSQNCAGFPANVKPATFNFTNATAHLELFNVKHFIARWEETKRALADSPDWKFIQEEDTWQLYELTTHNGRHVFVPEYDPLPVRVTDWQTAGLEWIYTMPYLRQPFVFLAPGSGNARWDTIMKEDDFTAHMKAARAGDETLLRGQPVDRSALLITDESVSDNQIRFKTNAPGLPHIVKCTYYPNWKVRGADCVFMVSPCFMLVYPNETEVELYYGRTLSDNVGRGVTGFGAILLVGLIAHRCRRPRRNAGRVR